MPRRRCSRAQRLPAILDEVPRRRLTSVVAGAGFGKSTLLAAWAADLNCAWYTASPEDVSLATFARGVADALRLRVPALPVDAANAVKAAAGPGHGRGRRRAGRGFAALICETLQTELRRDLVLVLDDVHEIAASAGAIQAIEALCRQAPERLHLVVASRAELPFPVERLRGQGQVLEITGSQLAFDVDETATLLAELTGGTDPAVAAELHRLTGGWPAAVRLAVEALRGVPPADVPAALERMRRAGGPLLAYLAAEVFAGEHPRVAELVARVAPLERFTAELCDALGDRRTRTRRCTRSRAAGSSSSSRARGSGLVRARRARCASSPSRGSPRATREMREVRIAGRAVVREPARAGGGAAVRSRPTRPRTTARLLEAHGGHAPLAAAPSTPCSTRPAGSRRSSARPQSSSSSARRTRSAATGTRRCGASSARPSTPTGSRPRSPGGWACCSTSGDGSTRRWRSTTGPTSRASRGTSRCFSPGARRRTGFARTPTRVARTSTRAFEVASKAGDPQALAAAHTVLAMLAALEGDRGANDAHYLRALDYAQQAGDVLQLVRVRTNRGSRHVEECSYEEAISELDHALRLADSPASRDVLMEALWPDQRPGPLGNRLSVLLSTVRASSTPASATTRTTSSARTRTPSGSTTRTCRSTSRSSSRRPRRHSRCTEPGRASAFPGSRPPRPVYTGDFLEEDAYEDWAVALREEARATYTAVARALADDAAARGDVDATTRYSLRVLERDPYDEPAHLGLVATLDAAGRHGEARRRFRTYCARMDEIGVESAPFPAART